MQYYIVKVAKLIHQLSNITIYHKIVTFLFNSLVIRLRSRDLKHLIPTPVDTGFLIYS